MKPTGPSDPAYGLATPTAKALIAAGARLRDEVGGLAFAVPVAYVYNPLVYAWAPHVCYLSRWGTSRRRVVFLGMNPGPWGMAQVGVPFGEIGWVRDWLGITGTVGTPGHVHPAKPVDGFGCRRSEVSGQRLWGFFATRFGSAEAFFRAHFVANYCPLMFLDANGRNLTPDRLRKPERQALERACDAHLRSVVDALQPHWVIGVGAFAAAQARQALQGAPVRVGSILHPSPASPLANRGWAEAAGKQLAELGVPPWGPGDTASAP